MRRIQRVAVVASALVTWLGETGGAWAAGSEVVRSHQGDTPPTSEGFGLSVVGDPLEALNHITAVGTADDQGFPVWAIDDATALAGVFYYASPSASEAENALAAGFTLRSRLRVVPEESALPTTPGVARVEFGGLGLRFGANAAPPGGDGSLRLLVEGASEVVLPGGAVHHLVELVYDPVTNTADVLADGLEVVSDVPAGFGSAYPDLEFGTTLAGMGEVRVNLVELEVQLPDCSDGLDNDGDGLSDLADPGCDDASDLDEADGFACNDGLDNDGDSLVDMADPGCATPTDEIEFDLVGAGSPWNAELRLGFEPGVIPGYPELELSSPGVVRLGTSAGGVPFIQFPGLSGTIDAPITSDPVVTGVRVDASLAPGALAVSSALPSNTQPLRGEVRLCLIFAPGCDVAFVDQPFSSSRFGVVGIGGGTSYGTSIVVDLGFAAWTLGTASARIQTSVASPSIVVTRKGFAHGPLSATSTFAQPSGVVQWVTPVQVDQIGANPTRNAIFASLRVRLVPEPGRFALLASGAAALLALARRRVRR